MLLLSSTMVPRISGAAVPADPLCSGSAPGTSACISGAVRCSNYPTQPYCGASSTDKPICSGITPTCSVSGGPPQCIATPGLINPKNIIFNGNSGSAQSLLTISLLIMLMMLLVSGLAYGIGYAFRIDKLVRFAKSEIGEVIVTSLIVLIFIGTFSVASSTIGTKNLFAASQGTFNDNIFVSDCSLLAENSFDLMLPLLTVSSFRTQVLSFVGSWKVSIAPGNWGLTNIEPLAGLSTLYPILDALVYVAFGLVAVLLGMTVFIAIIYSLFPLFLYLGIILRTLPWTRAAGGAFLGLFIAFYVVFPLLLYISLVGYIPYQNTPGLTVTPTTNPPLPNNPVTITATCFSSSDTCEVLIDNNLNYKNLVGKSGAPTGTYTFTPPSADCYLIEALDTNNQKSATQTLVVDGVGGVAPPCQTASTYSTFLQQTSPSGSFDPGKTFGVVLGLMGKLFTFGIINDFIREIIEPVMFTIGALIISLIISFDFMEALGDLLGAPSLKSKDSLKRIL